MYTCLRKKNLLRHGSATFPLKSTKSQFFSILQFYYINFSGSKIPWLIFFLFIALFNFLSNGILIIKFDALTSRKIIFKQHMKYVSVKFFCFFFKLTKC